MSEEKTKTMLMQSSEGQTRVLWYFRKWPILNYEFDVICGKLNFKKGLFERARYMASRRPTTANPQQISLTYDNKLTMFSHT